jgi:DNA (cytosine-5)-methyltransferase 1
MRVLDLFSGIGGFSLGLERAGFQTAAFCEIDPYCRKVLAKHWPGVKIHEDVKQLDGSQYAGTIDLICGGYPCQPFSVAGKQKGEKDPRHLWPEMHRIIRQARPRWIIAENVRGHVSLGFDSVASQLEDDGFTIWPFIVPACAVGAPHRRDRLWIIANAQSESWLYKRREDLQTRLFDRASYEARKGEPGQWISSPSRLCRVADGIPDRVESARVNGNAVAPQIPELIGRSILAYERQRALAT